MMFFLLLALFAAASNAQQCVCEGNRDGADCLSCKPGWLRDPDNTGTNWKCDYKCNPAIDCNGHGTCDYATKKCECVSPYDSPETGCDKCESGKTGYPLCLANTCDPGTDCNGKGVCGPEQIPCGLLGCNPDTQQCCKWTSPGAGIWIANTFYPPGKETFHCTPKTKTCCGRTTGTSCDWNEKCEDPGQGFCARTTQTEGVELEACIAKFENGTARAGNGQTCLPYQTCCDGDCCNGDEICEDDPEPIDGWVNNLGQPLNYKTQTCTTNKMIPASVIRVAILPAVLILVVLLSAVFVVASVGCGEGKTMLIPALLTVVCCLFLVLQQRWPYALALILSCYFAIGTTKATHPARFQYCLLVEVLAFAIFVGGLGIGDVFVQSAGMFASASTGTGTPYANLLSQQRACSNYYNYFWVDNSIAAWDADPSERFSGLCSFGWLTGVQFFTTIAMGCHFMLIVATGLAMLQASPGSNAANELEKRQNEF
jgi:hypothetical protein